MTLECSDGKSITLKFPSPLVGPLACHWPPAVPPSLNCVSNRVFLQQDPLDPYVEVLGRVDQDLTITVERIVNYGTDFGGCGSLLNYLIITSSNFSLIPNADLGAYNEVVQLAANFPQLFSPTHSQVKNEMDNVMQFWHHAYNDYCTLMLPHVQYKHDFSKR